MGVDLHSLVIFGNLHGVFFPCLLDSMFMFPVGLNLNDFKNSVANLSRRSGSGAGGGGNFLGGSTPGGGGGQQNQQLRDDDSSTDNNTSTTNLFQTLSTFTAPNPDLIQANLEKMMVSDALEVVSSLPLDLGASSEDDAEMKGDNDMDMAADDDEYLSMSDISVDTVLPDQVIPFSFKLPSAVPPYLNAHYTCETGSRLLFSSILWLGKVPVFQQLPEDLQCALIRSAWAEIFVLNFVQMSGQLSFNAVMSSLTEYFKTLVAQEQTPIEKVLALSDNICLFNEFVRDMDKLQLDDLSFAAIRVMILFSARGVGRDYPNYAQQMEAIVDVASQELRRQLGRSVESGTDMNEEAGGGAGGHKGDEQFVRVVMKVAALSKFSAPVIEELFFTNIQVSVENVIPYILRLGNSSNITVSCTDWG